MHEVDEGVDAFGWKGVVDARSHAADGAGAFQTGEFGGCGLLDELGVGVCVAGHERDVHL